jgi:hypothetical protein
MFPSRQTQLARIGACRSDLNRNGINLDALGPRALSELARRDLDYFQAMLGYDARPREVVELIGATARHGRSRAGPRDGPGRAARAYVSPAGTAAGRRNGARQSFDAPGRDACQGATSR